MKAINTNVRKLRPGLKAAVLLTALGAALSGGRAPAQSQSAANAARSEDRELRSETALKITTPFTVAAVGDIFLPQPLYSNDAGFQKMIERIRKADVGFANLESSLVDFQNYDGPLAGVLAPVEMGASIKAMGITMVNHANNQTFNGGVAGMMQTITALDKLGITHAGTGRNLQEARAAQIMATPKGRVALVGMFSMDDWSNYGPNFFLTAATYRSNGLGGAPGVNPLHLTAYRVVSPEQLQALKQMSVPLYGGGGAVPPAAGAPERFKFFNESYEAGTDLGALHYEMNPGDRRDIIESIRQGKIRSDFLVATIHSHHTTTYKGLGWGGVDHGAPDFLVALAHESIDNGADIFVAHGVHAMAGVEIYKGKPIFYGLSSFVFQFGLLMGQTPDAMANVKGMSGLENPEMHKTVLTTSHFENGQLSEVRLYPVDLGGSRRPISQLGIPMPASPEVGQQILKEMQEYSKPYGTVISIEDNVGVIRLDSDWKGTPKNATKGK